MSREMSAEPRSSVSPAKREYAEVDSPVIANRSFGCPHTKALRKGADGQKALKRYAAGLRYGRKVRDKQVSEEAVLKRDRYNSQLPWPCCVQCDLPSVTPFACFECAGVFCHLGSAVKGGPTAAAAPGSHMLAHLHETKHKLAFELHSGTILCAECDEFVLDSKFNRVLEEETRRAEGTKKRRKDEDKLEDALQMQQKLLQACKAPKGLRNMGATCYMNVVLQSFIHNPLLRNFFLSDRHNPTLCTHRENCLACEMDSVFSEFFSSGSSAAFGPTSFLFCLWVARESSELTSTGQHDAHELFINVLNGIHNALSNSPFAVTLPDDQRPEAVPRYPHEESLPQLINPYDFYDEMTMGELCPCAVHRTFAGVIQSDVTCMQCGRLNSTFDPFLDLSLDLKTDSRKGDHAEPDGKKANWKKKTQNSDVSKTMSSEPQDLVTCLKGYCRSETLDAAAYTCSSCGMGSQATKQLSIARFPPILCIQLKRFEHNSTAAKVDTPVRFPLELDMRDFCTGVVRQDGHRMHKDPGAYVYELFTTVVHEGSLTTGHYTNYSKWRDQWYFFDDDKVHLANEKAALNPGAYQLCYRRRDLFNLPSWTLDKADQHVVDCSSHALSEPSSLAQDPTGSCYSKAVFWILFILPRLICTSSFALFGWAKPMQKVVLVYDGQVPLKVQSPSASQLLKAQRMGSLSFSSSLKLKMHELASPASPPILPRHSSVSSHSGSSIQ